MFKLYKMQCCFGYCLLLFYMFFYIMVCCWIKFILCDYMHILARASFVIKKTLLTDKCVIFTLISFTV